MSDIALARAGAAPRPPHALTLPAPATLAAGLAWLALAGYTAGAPDRGDFGYTAEIATAFAGLDETALAAAASAITTAGRIVCPSC